jgi:serine/threonine-protein kinase HipA
VGLALDFNGRKNNLKRRHFVEFGERYGVPPAVINPYLDKIRMRSPAWIERLEEIGLDEKQTRLLRREMKKRRDDLR